MTADWQRSQAALLAMGERMGQLHERNPGAGSADARVALVKVMVATEIAGGFCSQDSLIELAATALYAWVVLDEEGQR